MRRGGRRHGHLSTRPICLAESTETPRALRPSPKALLSENQRGDGKRARHHLAERTERRNTTTSFLALARGFNPAKYIYKGGSTMNVSKRGGHQRPAVSRRKFFCITIINPKRIKAPSRMQSQVPIAVFVMRTVKRHLGVLVIRRSWKGRA